MTRYLRWLRVLTFGLAIAIGMIAWRLRAGAPSVTNKSLPVLATLPSFKLTERSGRSFSLHDLKGHIWVADFFFTGCAGTCPEMTAQMQRLQNNLLKDTPVNFVSFTVDPKNDTPENLRLYAKGWNAIDGRWFFVTGDKKALHQLAQQGFKLAVVEVPNDDGPFTHSEKFALVDRAARIRGYYDGTSREAMKHLKHDVERLLQE